LFQRCSSAPKLAGAVHLEVFWTGARPSP
jgi:hypothetical protein